MQERSVSSSGLNGKFKFTCDLFEEDSGLDYFVTRTAPLYLPARLERLCSSQRELPRVAIRAQTEDSMHDQIISDFSIYIVTGL